MSQTPALSIVTTVYNLADFVVEFHRRMSEAAQKITDDYEIIFVNDGSPDNAETVIRELCDSDDKVALVNLSRNFGHHHAILAGLSQTRGERVFLIDVDLEENPDWLIEFDKTMQDSKCDVVYGVQKKRKGNWDERIFGWLFYFIFNLLSDTKIPPSACIARLMNRQFVDAVVQIDESNIFFPGLFSYVGFKQIAIPIEKTSRDSATTYSYYRKLRLMGNAITSFSSKPLYLIFLLGCLSSFFSASFGSYLIFRKLFLGVQPVTGWSSLMVSIWFLGGIIIMFLGIIGIYISKIFTESKHRPIYILNDVYRHSNLSESSTDSQSQGNV